MTLWLFFLAIPLVVCEELQDIPQCLVTLPACKLKPRKVGTFLDDPKVTLTEARCLRRAEEWTKICDNPWDQVAYVQWLPSGKAAVYPDGCAVFTLSCVSDPTKSNKMFLEDNIKTQAECSARAKYWHKKCQNPQTVTVASTWVYSGYKEEYPQGCIIDQDNCPTNTLLNGTFIDYLPSSKKWMDRCMERAKEIHEFCSNTNKTVTMAVYASTGNVTTFPGACVVIQPMCSAAAVYSGIFLDKQANNSTVCMDRASHWGMVCDNEPQFTTTMKWTASGQTKTIKGTRMAVPENAGFREVPQNHVTLQAQSLASAADSLLDKLDNNDGATAFVSDDSTMRFKESEFAVAKGPISFDDEDEDEDEDEKGTGALQPSETAPSAETQPAVPPAWLQQEFSTPTFED